MYGNVSTGAVVYLVAAAVSVALTQLAFQPRADFSARCAPQQQWSW